MKNIFRFKTFRKNIGLVCFGIVLLRIMDWVNNASISIVYIIVKDIMFFLLFFLLGMVADIVQETRLIYNKPDVKRQVLFNVFFVIILVLLLFVDIGIMSYLR
ncbi:MAG: hypothetical protein PHD56_03295 [Anaerostipes sp.]|nr:hypothetical protein [Anaerostipes sp.]